MEKTETYTLVLLDREHKLSIGVGITKERLENTSEPVLKMLYEDYKKMFLKK